MLAAATVAVLAIVELATLFPRADIDHVVPAVPGFLVAILFAWHVAAGSGRAGGRVTATRRPLDSGWCRPAALSVVAVACVVRLSASGAALVSPARTWSALPHLSGVLLPKAREAELAADADALRGAAAGEPLFLLMPDAGLYYLVSGLTNPTPFDYPLATAFGRTGEADLATAIEAGRVTRVVHEHRRRDDGARTAAGGGRRRACSRVPDSAPAPCTKAPADRIASVPPACAPRGPRRESRQGQVRPAVGSAIASIISRPGAVWMRRSGGSTCSHAARCQSHVLLTTILRGSRRRTGERAGGSGRWVIPPRSE